MARIATNDHDTDAILTIRGDRHNEGGEVCLVSGGRRAYLACHPGKYGFVSVSGPKVLRKLANAILKELGARGTR